MNKKLILFITIPLLLCSCQIGESISSDPISSSTLPSSISSESIISESISSNTSSTSSKSSSSFLPSISSLSSIEPSSLWDNSQDNLRNGVKELNFYNVNDFHGAVEFNNDRSISEPGIFKLATYLKEVRNESPESFVLTSSGDMWQGSADSNLTYGKLVLDWMKEVNFEAMAIGNHEFDWTIDKIIENQKYMEDIPFLGCNILYKDSLNPVEWAKPFTTITRNGVHIGIIGAIGEGITSDITASYVKNIVFDDPTPYVKIYSQFLKENGADMILYLHHNSMAETYDGAENFDPSLYDYVDLCFAGHSHAGDSVLISSHGKKIPIVQAWCNGKDVGKIQMNYDFDNNKCSYVSKKIIDTRSFVIEDLDDDPETIKIYNKYSKYIHDITDVVKGYTVSGISRFGELESLANEYMLKAYLNDLNGKYNISLVKHNSARSDIPSGEITYGNIYKAFPFDNHLTLLKVKGAFIKSSNSFMSYYSDYDYFPNGYSFDYDKYYYILTINYISEKYSYLETREEDYLHFETISSYSFYVRDIIAEYIGDDYPIL